MNVTAAMERTCLAEGICVAAGCEDERGKDKRVRRGQSLPMVANRL